MLALTQSEADTLMRTPKYGDPISKYQFPGRGDSLTIPVYSQDKREQFLIDVNRKGNIRLLVTYQERYRKNIILVRLDLDGRLHDNPMEDKVPAPYLSEYNGAEKMPCPHLHLYFEGYGDRWAIPAPVDRFPQLNDVFQTLYDFFQFCNVVEPPQVDKGLFS